MLKNIFSLFLGVCGIVLTACGQIGPLYLPSSSTPPVKNAA